MADEHDFHVKDKRSSSVSEDVASSTRPSPASNTGDDSSKQPPAEEASQPTSIDFSTFILSLSTSAAMSLGGYQDPESGHIPKNLEHARQSIDILSIIQTKTKGNLTAEENDLLEKTLYELRMRYVQEVKGNY